MSNCDITIQIINYEPKKNTLIPFNDLICIFQINNYEGTINIGQYKFQKINHQINNIKKDLKYTIKIFNFKTILTFGFSEIIIPFSLIKNSHSFTKNEINKKCIIKNNEINEDIIIHIKIRFQILNAMKYYLPSKRYNMSLNSLNKKNIKIKNPLNQKFNYFTELQKEFNNSPFINKLTTKPNEKNIKTLSNIPLSSYRTYKRSIDKNKKFYLKNDYYSLRMVKENNNLKSKKSKSIINDNSDLFLNTSPTLNKFNRFTKQNYVHSATDLKNPFDDTSKNLSTIEPNLYDNYIETEDNSEKVKKEIYSYLNNINYKAINNKSLRESINQKTLKEKIENLIHFHSLFILKLKHLIVKKNYLKKELILNHENLNQVKKQYNAINKLIINLNSSKIKVNLNLQCNLNIYRNQNQIRKKELKIFQNIFNLHYFEYDILKYKESLINKNIDDKNIFNLLLNCIKGCIFSFGNISDIYDDREDLKIKFKEILFKNNIKENEEIYGPIVKDNIIILRTINNKKHYGIKPIIAIKEVDEEKEYDSEDSIYERNIDKKIKEIENMKLTSVKINKLSNNLIQFGSKKIKVKLENSELKVELDNNKFIKLEEFININKNTEEILQKAKKPFFNNITIKTINK